MNCWICAGVEVADLVLFYELLYLCRVEVANLVLLYELLYTKLLTWFC